MNRRRLLKELATVPLLPILWRRLPASHGAISTAVSANFPPPPPLARRVRPSDPSWPAASSWDALKQAVGGRLVPAPAPYAACRGQADTAACQAILKDLQNPYYIGDQPGGTQSSGWVDAWMSAPSVYAVAAAQTSDVVAAVNFVREHNLRLVVKGGGHSYQGTSNAPDSLLVWTRAMNAIVVHDAFVAQGCAGRSSPQPAVSVGAGAMWSDAYNAVTTKSGRYVQGGGCATVGVAGLIQSGGFGSFSKNFSSAAGGLIEAEVVTADGAVRIANACTNPDLFWGIKGGGGGSLGVITRVTLRTRELPVFFGGAGATILANSDQAYRRLVTRFISLYSESLFNPHWGETVSFDGHKFHISMVFQGLDQDQAAQVWKPFLDWVKSLPSDFMLSETPYVVAIEARNWWNAEFWKKASPSTVRPDDRAGVPAWHTWWSGDSDQVGLFWHGYESVWLPASLLHADQQARLVDALINTSSHWSVQLHFNKGLAGAPADALEAARDTAMNPAVLSAFALAIIAGGGSPAYPGVAGHEPDLSAARDRAREIARAMDELMKVAPEGGAYVSESNYFQRSWQRAFWGSNYPRLQQVKAKYDPAGLFFVHHGVGSEAWSADGFTPVAAR